MTPIKPTARLLMCRPEHFAVSYTINPWMDPDHWARDASVHSAAAHREWTALYRKFLELGAAVELVPAATGVPDLVFTANAAVVLDRKVLLARFRHPERRSEEPYFQAAFNALKARGLVDSVQKLPDGVVLEGAGDCVFDQTRNMFWLGYAQRSDASAQRAVEDTFGVRVTALELADPRFYHMDTALSPLPRGEVMYVPEAFTPAGRNVIREFVPRSKRIEIGIGDAEKLAANAVCLGDTLVMGSCSDRLRGTLEERGYGVATTPLRSFLKSGGSAFCLTLRLDRQSKPASSAVDRAAVA
jgi:N-dimethylarginine dimethylaminohydrolase